MRHHWTAISLAIVVVFAISSICVSFNQQQQISISGNQQQHTFLLANAILPLTPTANAMPQSSFSSGANNGVFGNLSTRAVIMQYIIANPGVYLRELSEVLQLPLGVVQYHMWFLVKSGQVEDYRNGRYRRFFVANTYGDLEKKVLSLSRQSTESKILTLLAGSTNANLSHAKLAEMLGITSQALTWQMGRLKAMGIVESSFIHRNGGLSYRLISEVCRFMQQNQF